MYRIIHPMNNNVALVQNELQQELIVIGSGIAFGKKKNRRDCLNCLLLNRQKKHAEENILVDGRGRVLH